MVIVIVQYTQADPHPCRRVVIMIHIVVITAVVMIISQGFLGAPCLGAPPLKTYVSV